MGTVHPEERAHAFHLEGKAVAILYAKDLARRNLARSRY